MFKRGILKRNCLALNNSFQVNFGRLFEKYLVVLVKKDIVYNTSDFDKRCILSATIIVENNIDS